MIRKKGKRMVSLTFNVCDRFILVRFKHLFQNIYIKNKKNFSKQHWVNLRGSKYIWYSICSSPFEREGRVEVLKSKVKVYHDETQNSSPALPYQKSQVKSFRKCCGQSISGHHSMVPHLVLQHLRDHYNPFLNKPYGFCKYSSSFQSISYTW